MKPLEILDEICKGSKFEPEWTQQEKDAYILGAIDYHNMLIRKEENE